MFVPPSAGSVKAVADPSRVEQKNTRTMNAGSQNILTVPMSSVMIPISSIVILSLAPLSRVARTQILYRITWRLKPNADESFPVSDLYGTHLSIYEHLHFRPGVALS